jgi:hypothetical protein
VKPPSSAARQKSSMLPSNTSSNCLRIINYTMYQLKFSKPHLSALEAQI